MNEVPTSNFMELPDYAEGTEMNDGKKDPTLKHNIPSTVVAIIVVSFLFLTLLLITISCLLVRKYLRKTVPSTHLREEDSVTVNNNH